LKIPQRTKYLVCYSEFFLIWRFVIAGTFYCTCSKENAGTLKIFCYSEDSLIAGIVIPSFRCIGRIIILSCFGTLECRINLKGKLPENCSQCHVVDNENHRLNYCVKWGYLNLYHQTEKVPFDDVYSDNLDKIKNVVEKYGVFGMSGMEMKISGNET
jgi:hypothetical protein